MSEKLICEMAEKCKQFCNHRRPHKHVTRCANSCTHSEKVFGIRQPKCVPVVNRDIQKQFDELIGEL